MCIFNAYAYTCVYVLYDLLAIGGDNTGSANFTYTYGHIEQVSSVFLCI